MSNNEDIAGQLVDVIRKNIRPYKMSTDGRTIQVRCPYCGDSKKSEYSTHFYIYLTPPYGCHCFKCSTHVFSINSETMKDLKIYDNTLSKRIGEIQTDYKYNKQKTKNILNFNNNEIINPNLKGTKNELIKLNYLNTRLGLDISLNEAIHKFKIILNFKEFIKANNILEFTKKEEDIETLYKYCIGFLSYDNNFIIFRSLDERITGFRYQNYRIFNNFDDAKKFYILHSRLNVLKEKINVVITEGILDIISVYKNFYEEKLKDNDENYLFISCNGKSFNLIFNYLSRLGFLDQNIYIYSDNDVSMYFYQSLKNKSSILNNFRINIYYNDILGKNGKSDFGVPKNEIRLRLANKL